MRAAHTIEILDWAYRRIAPAPPQEGRRRS
jgi:hypothetical protein